MTSNMGITMTLANSIIGVSVLAMPFCFKQCGIILSIVMLLLSSMLSRYACHYLLKAAIMARRRNFEFLAFHAYGPTGKFLVELCIIGFLMGTCIAFFVVVGDLGPAIVAKTLGVDDSSRLRSSVLVGLALFVVLPLGLLRNVDSLSAISMATIGFYVCLVLKVVVEALPHLLAGDWLEKVHLWRPSGIMQCIPIFSMALSCQTQLFEIYESLYNASLDRMNDVIKAAINMCTGVYICVGFFGYVAFCTQNFTGNILMSFAPTTSSEIFKLGFVLSVAVSFPLVIFPCRASLYSLLFRRAIVYHEGASSHIPENRFKWITIFLVGASLGVGLLIPNIELVLGLVGSTIGVLICVIFPAAAFIRVSPKASSERLAAQAVLFTGVLILFLGTYATLYSASEAASTKVVVPQEAGKPLAEDQFGVVKNKLLDKKIAGEVADTLAKAQAVADPAAVVSNKKPPEKSVVPDMKKPAVEVGLPAAEVRREPAAPAARQEPPVPVEPPAAPAEVPVAAALKAATVAVPKEEVVPLAAAHVDVAPAAAVEEPPKAEVVAAGGVPAEGQRNAQAAVKAAEKHEENPPQQRVAEDAIRKEDSELAEAQRQADSEKERREAELLETLARHKQEQEQLLREQQDILHQMKQQQDKLHAADDGKSPKDRPKSITEKLSKKSKPSEGETVKEFNPQANVVKPVIVGIKADVNEIQLKNEAAQSIENPLPAVSLKSPNQQAVNVKPSQTSDINAPKQRAAESEIVQAGAVNQKIANEKSLENNLKVVVAKAEGEQQKQVNDGAVKHYGDEKSPPVPSAHAGGLQVPSLADIVYSRKAPRPAPASAGGAGQKTAAEVSSGTVLLDRLKGNVELSKKNIAGNKIKQEAESPQQLAAQAHAREKREAESAAQEGNCDVAEKAASSHFQTSGSKPLAEDIIKQPENNVSSKYLPHIAPTERDDSPTPIGVTEKTVKSIMMGNVNVLKDSIKESIVKANEIVGIKPPEIAKKIVTNVADNSSNLIFPSEAVMKDLNQRDVAELGIGIATGAPQHANGYSAAVEVKKLSGSPVEVKAPQHLSPPNVSLPPPVADSDDHLSAAGVKPLSRDLKSAKDDEAEDNT